MIKIKFLNPKAAITEIAGTTGITTPSVIAGQRGGEVTVLANKVSEVKIDLESKQNNLETMKNDYENIKKLLEEKNKLNKNLQAMLSGVVESSKKRNEENKRIMEMLERDRAAMGNVIKPNVNIDKRDIKGFMDYLHERCSYGLCDEEPEVITSVSEEE